MPHGVPSRKCTTLAVFVGRSMGNEYNRRAVTSREAVAVDVALLHNVGDPDAAFEDVVQVSREF